MSLLARSACLLLVAFQLAWACGAHAQNASYRGRPVHEVIDELRAAGAPLVYSSNLVPGTLRVREEPSSADPLGLALEILAPFGLTVRETDGGWLVVRTERPPDRPEPGRVLVSVSASDTGEPVAGATVQLDAASGGAVLPIRDGRAEFAAVAPGRHSVTARAPGYLPERAAVQVPAAGSVTVDLPLLVAAPPLEQITVTASRYELGRGIQPSERVFSRDEIAALSELGDDTLRVAHRLPGIAAAEFSARSHVRGGAADEMAVVLDGVELVEPFHLRDYQSVFSAVDQRIVENVHIYSGGFPAEYGEALSGLTVIEPAAPDAGLRHELGLSLLQTSALSTGRFAADNGGWLVSLRRGNVDRLLSDNLGEPAYRDAFFHVGGRVGARHTLSLNGIALDDDLFFTPEDEPGRFEAGATSTDADQAWLKLESEWTERVFSRTLLHRADLGTRRSARLDVPAEIIGVVDDVRALEAIGIDQDWQWQPSNQQLVRAGIELTRIDAEYRYSSAVAVHGVLATLAGRPPDGARDARLEVGGERYGVHVADRIRVSERVIAELGLRWDRQTYSPAGDDSQVAPRASLLYRVAGNTDLRLSYGRYHQSESLLDLQLEDGVAELPPAQRAAHAIVGLEHRFGSGVRLRVEAFRKSTHTARPRYENLFDPFALAPELRPGRVAVRPERAEARGIEWLVEGVEPFPWWFGYSLARSEDVIAGRREPRSWDQRHALTGGVTWEAGAWALSANVTHHTGWPVTAITLDAGAPPTVVAGARNAERLSTLGRLDLRAARTVTLAHGALEGFAEVTNATDRRNPCCVSYEPVELPNGTIVLSREDRAGLTRLVNLGVLWQF